MRYSKLFRGHFFKVTYDKRVENREPLNVCVRHRLENIIPSARPLGCLVLLKNLNFILSKDDVNSLILSYLEGYWVRVCYIDVSCSCRWDCHWFCRRVRTFPFLCPLVVNGARNKLYSNNPSSQNISQIFTPVLILSVMITEK